MHIVILYALKDLGETLYFFFTIHGSDYKNYLHYEL